MIVVDASALVVAVGDSTARNIDALHRIADGATAPHLVDAEVGQALRGLVLRRRIAAGDARTSLLAAQRLVVRRFVHGPLAGRAWELRENLTFYDALYVALAEVQGLPLLTADARLAAADGPRCPIQVV